MQAIIDVLKSRGKTGAWLIMLIGVGMFAAIGFGKMDATATNYTTAGTTFGLGLSLLGIRNNQTPPTTPTAPTP